MNFREARELVNGYMDEDIKWSDLSFDDQKVFKQYVSVVEDIAGALADARAKVSVLGGMNDLPQSFRSTAKEQLGVIRGIDSDIKEAFSDVMDVVDDLYLFMKGRSTIYEKED